MREVADVAEHWDRAYQQGVRTRSWFHEQPNHSLRLFEAIGVAAGDSVIDVGGGASPLVDALLARGHTDVTVLDISEEALQFARSRTGRAGDQVDWKVADLLSWRPTRTWDIWHDRAVLHFFTAPGEREQYLRVLLQSTRPGSVALFATFAPDGPGQCSGLPVAHYGPDELARLLGDRWQLITATREQHATPGGSTQPFTWAGFSRLSA